MPTVATCLCLRFCSWMCHPGAYSLPWLSLTWADDGSTLADLSSQDPWAASINTVGIASSAYLRFLGLGHVLNFTLPQLAFYYLNYSFSLTPLGPLSPLSWVPCLPLEVYIFMYPRWTQNPPLYSCFLSQIASHRQFMW